MNHRIIELRSANVKCLRAISIEPNGNMVVIGGNNGQGKSSILDSLVMALAGGRSIPSGVVRRGEERADIILQTDTGLVIKRVIHADGKTNIDIRQVDEDGMESKVGSPQQLLNKLVGNIAFDPLAFTRMSPGDQVDMLKQVVGIDTTEVEKEIKEAFDSRTEVNRRLRDAEGAFKQLKKHEGVPSEEQSAGQLSVKIKEIGDENRRRQKTRDDHAAALRTVDGFQKAIDKSKQDFDEIVEEGKAEISRIEELLAQTKERYRKKAKSEQATRKAAAEGLVEAQAKADELGALVVSEDESTDELTAQLEQIDAVNKQVRENQAYEAAKNNVTLLQTHVDQLTERLESARKQKIEIMEAANWPLKGLGFSEDGVTFDGHNFTLLSSALQLKVSTAIGLSQQKKLPILLIRDGSLLDEQSLKDIAEIAQQYDAQVWVERVSTGAECSVIIEDGSIRETVSA